ncbi:heterokaryon incompatibility protein-domain-containing protein, partial [Dendryphion nanum]
MSYGEILYAIYVIILTNAVRSRTTPLSDRAKELREQTAHATLLGEPFQWDVNYRYSRLESPRSIRILTLAYSSSFEAPLECIVTEVSLDEGIQYTALSYAWESAEGTTPILCEGKYLDVTKNCSRALHIIRQRARTDINLWVDAICIDQNNTPPAIAERTQQIQIMGEIYRSAAHVVAWVGDHTGNSRTICDFLTSVG